MVQVRVVPAAFCLQVKTIEFPIPGGLEICTSKLVTVAAEGAEVSTFVSVAEGSPPPPMGMYCVPVSEREAAE